MENRFGVKDFFLFLFLGALMVLIILAPLLFTGAGLVLFLAVIQALARH